MEVTAKLRAEIAEAERRRAEARAAGDREQERWWHERVGELSLTLARIPDGGG